MNIQENILLAPLTTFGIGGPARFFIRARSVLDIQEALLFAQQKQIPFFILGGGSNILVDDNGFNGLVIKIELTGVVSEKDADKTHIIAYAGENWDTLVEKAVQSNLWGLENLSGIPGTVGGAVVQNIGAYGAALSQTLSWVEVLNTTTQEIQKLSLEECQFGYRESIFKKNEGRYIVLRAAFSLSSTPLPNLSYKDLAQHFVGATPTLSMIREATLAIRRSKFPDLSSEGTAGSFFKNPVVPEAQAQKLQTLYPGMPVFPLPESGGVKIPLGWLLDYRHGVVDMREVAVGGARLFEKQFLVIAAERNTSSRDVKKLAEIVQEKIRTICGINIEPEVYILHNEVI